MEVVVGTERKRMTLLDMTPVLIEKQKNEEPQLKPRFYIRMVCPGKKCEVGEEEQVLREVTKFSMKHVKTPMGYPG